MSTNHDQLQSEVAALNEKLQALGFPGIVLLSPKEIKGQDVNARYMLPEKFQQLVRNIKRDNRLESAPLVYHDGEQWRVISGHHRVKASVEAGLDSILCFITTPESRDELTSKQLSHNALVGTDDKVLLQELFNSIRDIDLKIGTGLNSDIGSINYQSINFRLGEYKELTIMFLPEELEDYDNGLEIIAREALGLKSQTEVRTTDISYYDKFADTLRRIKKIENIKSNGVALLRMVELAQERLQEYATQHNLDDPAE